MMYAVMLRFLRMFYDVCSAAGLLYALFVRRVAPGSLVDGGLLGYSVPQTTE